jgi:hypothetical protein
MGRTKIKYLLAGCFIIGSVTETQIALWRMRPPLFKEYHALEDEIYTKYLTDGALPAPIALSASARRTLSEHRQIQYTAKDGLGYKYDKAYPMNVPLAGLITLGFWWGGEEVIDGESERPELLIHNAELRAENAR